MKIINKKYHKDVPVCIHYLTGINLLKDKKILPSSVLKTIDVKSIQNSQAKSYGYFKTISRLSK